MAKVKKLPKFVKLIKPVKEIKNSFDVKAFAEVAAKSAARPNELGAFIEVIEEGEGVHTYLFEANQKGYVGWRWSVTVFQLDPSSEPTLSEVVMIPSEGSIKAPNWVPWAERLADYQALQQELEKQAKEDAEANAVEAVTEEEVVLEEEVELAVADFEVSEETKDQAN